MGRRPNALAAKREKDKVDITAVVLEPGSSRLDMPPMVSEHPLMRSYWECIVGDGMGFRAEDAQPLQQLVFDYVIADECREQMMDEDGNIQLFKTIQDENGFDKRIENPYLDRLHKATTEIMKLSAELGLTPMSRARLGLTTASAKAVNVSIAETVMKALKDV